MIDLHFNTTLNVNPLIIPVEELPTDFWNLIPVNLINTDLLDFFFSKGIKISKISSFYEEYPNCYNPNGGTITNGGIHTDCFGIGDMYKLIWMWGDDHKIAWYLPKSDMPLDYNYAINDHTPSSSIRNYTTFTLEQMDEIYSTKIEFPSLIQVGVPHAVVTLSGKRRSLSMVLEDLNNNFITMNNAKLILKDYLVDSTDVK